MTLDADIAVRRGDMLVEAELGVDAGKTLAVVGPNGSGKSTAALAIAGLVAIECGTVRLGGRVLDDGGVCVAARMRDIGVVFQDRLLFPRMSAVGNVAFGLRARGASRRDARRGAMGWLEKFNIAGCAHTRADRLSGGQAQRVAIARALAVEPVLLILDEPMSALDALARAETRRLIRSVLDEFAGVKLLITHEPLEALTLGERVVVMESGRVVQSGTPDEIRQTPRSAYAASFVGINLIAGVLRRDGQKLEVDCGRAAIRVGEADLPDGAESYCTIHPRAITLSVDEPHGSARNTIRGPVLAIDHIDGRARVDVGGEIELSAEITGESCGQMSLGEGSMVWASFKATEVRVYGR